MHRFQSVALLVVGLALFIAGPFMAVEGTAFTFNHPLTIYIAAYWAIGILALIYEVYTMLSENVYRETRFALLKKKEGELFFAGFIISLGISGFCMGVVVELFSSLTLKPNRAGKNAERN